MSRLYTPAIILSLLFATEGIQAQVSLNEVASMPAEIQESSGLLYFSGSLYTHNDSGGEAELYELDPDTGGLTRTITLENASNTDWEDLAQDESYVYIGDFGNNNGDRTDLRIYRVSKSDIQSGNSVMAGLIEFALSDQVDFEPRDTHPYDMEAFYASENYLTILTKDRENLTTTAYRLPKEPGSYLAEALDSGNVQGLVTGVDYDAANRRIYILGYSNLVQPFVAQVDMVDEDLVFQGDLEREGLNIGFAQAEGIAWAGGNQVYITTEDFGANPFGNSPALLYSAEIDLLQDTDPPGDGEPGDGDPPTDLSNSLTIYQPPNSEDLHFLLNTQEAVFGRGIFSSNGVMVEFTPPEELDLQATTIPVSHLSTGIYYLVYYLRTDILVAAFHVP